MSFTIFTIAIGIAIYKITMMSLILAYVGSVLHLTEMKCLSSYVTIPFNVLTSLLDLQQNKVYS